MLLNFFRTTLGTIISTIYNLFHLKQSVTPCYQFCGQVSKVFGVLVLILSMNFSVAGGYLKVVQQLALTKAIFFISLILPIDPKKLLMQVIPLSNTIR